MANRKHVESIPVGPLAIVALSGSKALGNTVDAYIADWRMPIDPMPPHKLA